MSTFNANWNGRNFNSSLKKETAPTDHIFKIPTPNTNESLTPTNLGKLKTETGANFNVIHQNNLGKGNEQIAGVTAAYKTESGVLANLNYQRGNGSEGKRGQETASVAVGKEFKVTEDSTITPFVQRTQDVGGGYGKNQNNLKHANAVGLNAESKLTDNVVVGVQALYGEGKTFDGTQSKVSAGQVNAALDIGSGLEVALAVGRSRQKNNNGISGRSNDVSVALNYNAENNEQRQAAPITVPAPSKAETAPIPALPPFAPSYVFGFDHDSSFVEKNHAYSLLKELTDKQVLNNQTSLIDYFQANNLKFTLTASSSAMGSDAYNTQLAAKRAEALMNHLRSQAGLFGLKKEDIDNLFTINNISESQAKLNNEATTNMLKQQGRASTINAGKDDRFVQVGMAAIPLHLYSDSTIARIYPEQAQSMIELAKQTRQAQDKEFGVNNHVSINKNVPTLAKNPELQSTIETAGINIHKVGQALDNALNQLAEKSSFTVADVSNQIKNNMVQPKNPEVETRESSQTNSRVFDHEPR